MKYLKFYDLEETYINEKSSLKYFNVSYTKDTDKTWIKEEEPYLLMKFKVEEAIINNEPPASPTSYSINTTYDNSSNNYIHKVLTRKICNDLSVFKSLQIGNDEPINIEIEEKENIIDSNSFILNENDYFTSTYIPESNINGEQQYTLVINEQFTKDDCIVIFDRSYEYPYNFLSISEAIGYGVINEINENTFDVGIIPTGLILFVIKKEGAELLSESSTITSDMLQYIISSSLKYNEVKNNEIYLPSVEGEYIVKGVLNQSIDSLSSLFCNNVNYEYTENTNIYDDIEINNDYEENIINLIDINIPKQISYLVNTFYECRKLKEVKIDKQSNITLIGDNAFYNCSSLTSITIPNSVTEIGDYAFYNCSSLSNITIPNSVKIIGRSAFLSCSDLREVIFDENSTCETIEDQAFSGCDGISAITIPSSVTSLSSNAFAYCYITKENLINKSSIIFNEDNVTPYMGFIFADEMTEDGLYIKDNNIIHCYPMTTSVTIPNYVTGFTNFNFYSSGVFSVVNNLESIKFEKNSQMKLITEYAFEGCKNIKNIELPKSIEVIEDYAFINCDMLEEVTFEENSNLNKYGSLYNVFNTSSNSIKRIVIPNENVSIGYKAFSGCVVHINDYIIIGKEFSYDWDFNGCIVYDTITNEGYYIRNNIFLMCSNKEIENVIIPNGITSIDYEAFYNCKLLTSITIPNSVTSIGSYAFNGCNSLTNIIMPDSVTSIGSYAFSTNLSSITFTENSQLNKIYDSAFIGCNIQSILLPKTVTYIGQRAFYNCDSLNEIICYATTYPEINNYTFYNVKSNGILKVPSGSDYSKWMNTSSYYLGYYNWTLQEI